MCEVAVCKGDDGGHARACSRVSRGECDGVQNERRDTQVCVGGVETTTTGGQGPGSGRSFNGERAGLAQQRACGPGRATHETPTCSAAGVRPGPGTPAVDVADPADGQKPGWVAEFGTDGFSTWPARCVLFTECTAQVTDGQSTCARVVNPSDCEICFCDAQGDVMAARVPRPFMDGTIRQGFTPSCRIPTTRAAMTSPAHRKNKPRTPRRSPREHMCSARP